MSGPRAEAEINPLPEAIVAPKADGHLPRWARVPAFAVRTGLAILTGTIAGPVNAEGAEICKIQVAFHAFTGIDMFPINETGRPGKLDNTEDPKTGPAVNFTGLVLDEKGNVLMPAQIERRTIPANQRSRILTSEFDRNNPNLKEEGYGITKEINTECNMPGRQVKVWLTTSQNPSDKEPRTIKNGEISHELVGRTLETISGIAGARQSELMPTDPRGKAIEEGLKDPTTVKKIEAEAERKRKDREANANKPGNPNPANPNPATPEAANQASTTEIPVGPIAGGAAGALLGGGGILLALKKFGII